MRNLRAYLSLIVVFVSLGFTKTYSQSENAKWQCYGKYSLGLVDNTNYSYFGFTVENQFKPRWTLNWNVEYQKRRDDIIQFHGSMGLIGGPAFMLWSLDNPNWSNGEIGGSILLGLMIMAAPDGVSYHIPIGYRWDLSPYANVLGFDFVSGVLDSGKNRLLYSISAGVRCSYWFADRYFAKVFVETRKAGYLGWNYGGGLALGWSIPYKQIETEQP
jgi:hypothetical protein